LKFDLVGIGNPVYDMIITPSVKTDGRVLSGCSTNACLAAKRLGMKRVGLIGCIGPDYAERFSDDMSNYGVEVASTRCEETGGFRLIYDDHGDRTLDVIGVAGKIDPKDLPDEFLSSRFILVGPILEEVGLDLVKFLRSATSALLFLDPQGMVRRIGRDRRIMRQGGVRKDCEFGGFH
jgi:sugar/nucleoside kinase (ribokinase family)